MHTLGIKQVVALRGGVDQLGMSPIAPSVHHTRDSDNRQASKGF
jgi:hypothetical protein